jgi:hypothetical protein
MKTLRFDPLTALKSTAYQHLNEHFNNVAMGSVHEDLTLLVAIARGSKQVHPVEARDALRAQIAQMILDASTPSELESIIRNMRAGMIRPTEFEA